MDHNLAILARSLSKATFGDLLDAVTAPWKCLRSVLDAPAAVARLQEVDQHAEAMLLRAEQLTANLEIAGFAAVLHVVNVAGRQRMLSQRLAKEALMSALLDGAGSSAARAAVERTAAVELAAALELTIAELADGLAYLGGLPLSNADISRELAHAVQVWGELQAALPQAGTATGQDSIATLSETLLAHFDRLTDHLERGVQALIH